MEGCLFNGPVSASPSPARRHSGTPWGWGQGNRTSRVFFAVITALLRVLWPEVHAPSSPCVRRLFLVPTTMSPHDLVRPRWGARARSPRRIGKNHRRPRPKPQRTTTASSPSMRSSPVRPARTNHFAIPDSLMGRELLMVSRVEQALRRTDDEATRMHLEDVRARIDDILEGDEA